jgi:hypothetical protein
MCLACDMPETPVEQLPKTADTAGLHSIKNDFTVESHLPETALDSPWQTNVQGSGIRHL